MPAAIFADEHRSGLTGVTVLDGIAVIVAVIGIAVVVDAVGAIIVSVGIAIITGVAVTVAGGAERCAGDYASRDPGSETAPAESATAVAARKVWAGGMETSS